MRKLLRNIVLGSAIAGSLLLPSCTEMDISKKETGIVREIFKKEPKILALEDYFVKESELNGLKVFLREEEGFSNKVYSQEQLEELKQSFFERGLDYYENLKGFGNTFYSFPDKEHNPSVAQLILEFGDEDENWEFLYDFSKIHNDDFLLFLNKNKSSIFFYKEDDMGLNEEKIFIDLLADYSKRVQGEFYWKFASDFFPKTLKIYENIGIPVKESGKYFGEALELQRKMYNMNNQEITDIFYKDFGFKEVNDKLEKYKNNELEKEELEKEIEKYCKKSWTKLFFMFPHFLDKICPSNNLDLKKPVVGLFYFSPFKENINPRLLTLD